MITTGSGIVDGLIVAFLVWAFSRIWSKGRQVYYRYKARKEGVAQVWREWRLPANGLLGKVRNISERLMTVSLAYMCGVLAVPAAGLTIPREKQAHIASVFLTPDGLLTDDFAIAMLIVAAPAILMFLPGLLIGLVENFVNLWAQWKNAKTRRERVAILVVVFLVLCFIVMGMLETWR